MKKHVVTPVIENINIRITENDVSIIKEINNTSYKLCSKNGNIADITLSEQDVDLLIKAREKHEAIKDIINYIKPRYSLAILNNKSLLLNIITLYIDARLTEPNKKTALRNIMRVLTEQTNKYKIKKEGK